MNTQDVQRRTLHLELVNLHPWGEQTSGLAAFEESGEKYHNPSLLHDVLWMIICHSWTSSP